MNRLKDQVQKRLLGDLDLECYKCTRQRKHPSKFSKEEKLTIKEEELLWFATSGHLKFTATHLSLLIVKSTRAPHTFESGLVV